MDRLTQVREFWDATPCDGHRDYAGRARFRYRKETWLFPFLERLASRYTNILEVGCGQGTDGVTLCHLLPPGSRYTGIDLSLASLERAKAAALEVGATLRVEPRLLLQNAEMLGFDSGAFDCVLSVGALHHSENTERAIAEVRRVLAPGGTAFVLLYRTWSPKLLAAHALRGVQRGIDAVIGTDRVCYRAARAWLPGSDDDRGTMVYECFGVPILRSYTRRGMATLFRNFSSLELTAHGPGLGYLWVAEARK